MSHQSAAPESIAAAMLCCFARRHIQMPAMQGQANKWVKNLEAKNGLRVLNLQMADMLRQMENAIQLGQPVLLQVRMRSSSALHWHIKRQWQIAALG